MATPQTSNSDGASSSQRFGKANGSNQPALKPTTFLSFETSAKRISKAHGEISISWKPLRERDAEKFIRATPVRDARQNFSKSRFRFLVVQYYDMQNLYQQQALLKAAKDKGWISKGFESFMRNRTTGSTVQESVDSLSCIAQTPQDDALPFFSLCLSSHSDLGYERVPDWNCLIFLGPPSAETRSKLDAEVLKELLTSDLFPRDYPTPIGPDMMILPLSLLRWQIDKISAGMKELKRRLTNVDDELLKAPSFDMKYMKTTKIQLFELRRMHGMLHQRYVFAREFAANIERSFGKLKNRSTNLAEGIVMEYSGTLKEALQTQMFNLETLKHDIKTAPKRIEAQYIMMDGQTSMMIARTSNFAAEEARRDSASMKTIAIVTLVFLPGTSLAAIFSMSMLDWMPQDSSDGSDNVEATKSNTPEVSHWFWIYWAITIPLTLVILLLWMLWYQWSNDRYKRKWEREMDWGE